MVLAQDPRLLVPQPRAGTAQCPWQGLKAYDIDDTDRFFGRDHDIQSCLDLLATGVLVLISSGAVAVAIMKWEQRHQVLRHAGGEELADASAGHDPVDVHQPP
mgnify:CR=1 FL=1